MNLSQSDNWKNLKPGQKVVVMQQINDVLQKELGVDYEFKIINDNNKGLGGVILQTIREKILIEQKQMYQLPLGLTQMAMLSMTLVQP